MRKPARAVALMLAAAALFTAASAASSTADTGTAAVVRCTPGLLRAVPQRVVAAWARNDAVAFAAVWAPDGVLVVGEGTRLMGRAAITAYMRRGYAGPMKGTRVTATAFRARCLAPTVGVVHTLGGILMPGERAVPAERRGIQTWVITKHGGRWLVSAYQNTRIRQR
jgi:uncharacterized protein (TIGR02246 family)